MKWEWKKNLYTYWNESCKNARILSNWQCPRCGNFDQMCQFTSCEKPTSHLFKIMRIHNRNRTCIWGAKVGLFEVLKIIELNHSWKKNSHTKHYHHQSYLFIAFVWKFHGYIQWSKCDSIFEITDTNTIFNRCCCKSKFKSKSIKILNNIATPDIFPVTFYFIAHIYNFLINHLD